MTTGTLPKLMVAPNGARLSKADHFNLPVTIGEIVETAIACKAQGADGIHAHIRDAAQKHTLDAGLYRELIGELGLQLPGFYVQITTESVGQYSPDQQRRLIYNLAPPAVSAALREIFADNDSAANSRLFSWTKERRIDVQHILYSPEEVTTLNTLVEKGIIPAQKLQVLFVLGRYTKNQVSDPSELINFVSALSAAGLEVDWAACAFGMNETRCLKSAFELGGKARVGFENNRFNSDGSTAMDNAERVREIASFMG